MTTTLNPETEYRISAAPRVKDIPERLRPRELYDRQGPEGLADDALLSIILRSGVAGTNVMELSRTLITRFGSLTGLAQASTDEISAVKGMGRVKAQVLKSSLELAKRLADEKVTSKPYIRTAEDIVGLIRERARCSEVEYFWIFLLDVKNRLKSPPQQVTKGILDASLVHPREVFKEAIRSSAAAVVLAHNHPSGDPSPSSDDLRITRRLVDAGGIIDIHVLDHVILGRSSEDGSSEYLSMREAGLVDFN